MIERSIKKVSSDLKKTRKRPLRTDHDLNVDIKFNLIMNLIFIKFNVESTL